MASKASAIWTGSLKEGKGSISTATGVLKDANYSFATRFEGADSGTTPEELIAAAHAAHTIRKAATFGIAASPDIDGAAVMVRGDVIMVLAAVVAIHRDRLFQEACLVVGRFTSDQPAGRLQAATARELGLTGDVIVSAGSALSLAGDITAAGKIDFETPVTLTANSKLSDKAAGELAVHVLHALSSIPEKVR